MKIKSRQFLLCLFSILFILNCASANTSKYIFLSPDVNEDMLHSEFWIKKCKSPDKVLMNFDEIQNQNELSCQTSRSNGKNQKLIVEELRSWEEKIPASKFLKMILPYNSKRKWYVKNDKIENENKKEEIHLLTVEDYKKLWLKMNLTSFMSFENWTKGKIPENQNELPVRKAVCIKRSDIRFVPDETFYCDNKIFWTDDDAQNSSIAMNDPLLVLWTSTDGKWVFVRTAYCLGWVRQDDVAYCSDDEFSRYFDYAKRCSNGDIDFVTITENFVSLPSDYSEDGEALPALHLGTYLNLSEIEEYTDEKYKQRFPHSSYRVEIPVRLEDGTLGFRHAAIPSSICVAGILPYTQRNVLQVSFKMLGERYSWGGLTQARDCSEFLLTIYKCFGFLIPRNSRDQICSPGNMVRFVDKSLKEKEKAASSLKPCTILGIPGHVMLYIGKDNGHYYVINDLHSYKTDSSDTSDIRALSVNINTLEIIRGNGKSWLENVTKAIRFEK